jgi:hypothetical protein
MSIALQWGYYSKIPSKSKGFLYFDAVTSLREQYSGQVTENPIDGGGKITDHFTRENPVITLSAVLSGVDISVNGVDITDGSINGEAPQNRKDKRAVKTQSVSVGNPTKNALTKYLPDVVGQFFKPTKPDISLPAQEVDTLRQMKDKLKSLFEDDGATIVSLYEYYGNNLKTPAISNLVMVGLSFSETPEQGEGLFCEITLKQVRFTFTKKEQIPKGVQDKLVAEDLKNKAGSLTDKGVQDSTLQENASKAAQKQIQCKPYKESVASTALPSLSPTQKEQLGYCAEEIAATGFNDKIYIPPLVVKPTT